MKAPAENPAQHALRALTSAKRAAWAGAVAWCQMGRFSARAQVVGRRPADALAAQVRLRVAGADDATRRRRAAASG